MGSLFTAVADKNSSRYRISLFTTEAGATESDVRIRVRRRIVQIQRKDAGIRRIVPIAAADEGAFDFIPFASAKEAKPKPPN